MRTKWFFNDCCKNSICSLVCFIGTRVSSGFGTVGWTLLLTLLIFGSITVGESRVVMSSLGSVVSFLSKSNFISSWKNFDWVSFFVFFLLGVEICTGTWSFWTPLGVLNLSTFFSTVGDLCVVDVLRDLGDLNEVSDLAPNYWVVVFKYPFSFLPVRRVFTRRSPCLVRIIWQAFSKYLSSVNKFLFESTA